MNQKILNGKIIAEVMEEEIKKEVLNYYNTFQKLPLLVTIMAGDEESSKTYIRRKEKACDRVGIASRVLQLPENATTEEVLNLIDEFNNEEDVTGILLQHPLPKTIDEQRCFDAILEEKDVDGVNTNNFGKMAMKKEAFLSATPKAILKILDYYEIPIAGSNVVIVGRSPILGKPLSMMLLNRDATVTVCHSQTKNLTAYLKNADIVIAACGRKEFVQKEWLKEGVILIDAGYHLGNVGDISKDAYEIASSYTPVPGGVGPVTIAEILENTILAAKKQKEGKIKNYQKTIRFE